MALQIFDKAGNLKQTIGILPAASFPALTGNVTTSAGSLATTVVGASGLFDISGASAGQIKFPATQNPSSDVNTLDDYEEGTWTPVIGGTGGTSGQSYTIQNGFYTKIGRLVCAGGDVALSNKGTITSNVYISLPFTSANINNYISGGIGYWAGMAITIFFMSGYQTPNTAQFLLQDIGGPSATTGTVATSDLTNTTELIFFCVYITP